ncbi:MAG TPA: beta-N-acetylhexosaminidase [Vicinamibacterales bacterium]|nr:beta-N-acetylhexosaminidase [Vicinamibacterales bacterium]
MSRLISLLVAATLVAAASCSRKPAPRVAPAPAAVERPHLVPLPARLDLQPGHFTLTSQTVIVADGDARRLGQYLSDFVGLAMGLQPLRVEPSLTALAGGAIVLSVRDGASRVPERYTLEVTEKTIRIVGDDPAGLFYGVQTLRQLLPAPFEYEALRPRGRNAPPVQIPAMTIDDRPRFTWRGSMLDVSRHFLGVEDVKRYIELMALHKLNRLHLHLADDQGWRIDIKSWPNLAKHGGSTEVGGGPGGYYTQEQYAEIVRYAADHFITIVPEIDMPGHTNAALASYAELNCDGVARPLYTGTEVGFSALCVEKDVTYKFIDDVVREIAALTPGPYFHIGGDEVKTLTAEQYAGFIERVQRIVESHGKQMIGWDEIAPTKLSATSIVQHWRPKTTPAEAVARGVKVIMSIADRAYLDMKYDAGTPIGLTWAGIVSVQTSYEWDPATAAQGVPESAVLGVEAPLWTETVATINDAEFLAFPRLAAVAEIGWSRQADRRWEDFRVRLGALGPRWVALGINFYRSPEVPWK